MTCRSVLADGRGRLAGSESVLDASCNKWKMSSTWCLSAHFCTLMRERFGSPFESFGGSDQCGRVAQPIGPDLRSFMQQKPKASGCIDPCVLVTVM